MKTDIKALRQNIDELCASMRLKIRYRYVDRWSSKGTFYPRERRIETTPIRSRIDYFNALHELGHAALGHGKAQSIYGSSRSQVYAAEVAAWKWAQEHSIIPLTPLMQKYKDVCLESYQLVYRQPKYFTRWGL